MLDALSAMVGLSQRPADPPLPLPGQVSLRTPPEATDPSPAAAALPTIAPPNDSARGPALGRLGSATASLPLLSNQRSPAAIALSGPPPDLAVRSGPPAGLTLPPLRQTPGLPLKARLLPPLQVAPKPSVEPETVQRAVPQRLVPAAPASAGTSEDDMIDPKLLRAAKMLDAERRVPRPETLDEIDLIEVD